MSLDTAVRDFFAANQSDMSTIVFAIISISAYILFFLVLTVSVYKKNKIAISKLAIGFVALYLTIEAVKILTGRARPDGSDAESFPSRHTALAFFLAYLWPTKDWTGKMVVYGFAILVGISRLVLDLHWFTDVIAGALIGLAFGYVIEKINWKKFLKLIRR